MSLYSQSILVLNLDIRHFNETPASIRGDLAPSSGHRPKCAPITTKISILLRLSASFAKPPGFYLNLTERPNWRTYSN